MATTLELGRGYVTLFVKDKSYHDAMDRAEKRFVSLAAAMTKAFSSNAQIRRATVALDHLEKQADRTATSIRALTGAYIAMNAAINPSKAAAMAALMTAAGNAQAAMTRASGAASAAQTRAQGSAQGSVARGVGAGNAAVIRSHGSAAAAVIRSVGSAMSSTIKAVGIAFSGTIRASAQLLRAAFSPITALFGGIRRGIGMMLSPAGLLGMLGVGVGGGMSLVKIRDESVEMESKIINLGRVAELSGDKLDKLVTSIKTMGQTMAGVKIDDLFSISTMAAKMGVSGNSLGSFTRDIAKMSVVLEDIPTEEAVQRIGRLISVFRLGHEDAIRFGSALTALDISSTADARDILDITTRFAGLASAFKMTAADAMALATAIRQSGIPLETGGTATTQIMSRMSSRRDMPAFAKIAGMSTKEFRQGMETDVLGTFTRVLAGMEKINTAKGPVALAQAMDKLHLDGQRVRGAFTQLIPVIGTLGEYIKISRDEWESLDAIQTGFELKSKSAKAQLELMANNFKLLAAEIGTGFLPFIKQAADGISVLTIDLQKFFVDNRARIEAWSEKFGRAFHKVGVLFREFPTFVKLGVAVAQEKWLQFIEILKRTPAAIKTVFGKLGLFLGDFFREVADNITARFTNVLTDVISAWAGNPLARRFAKLLDKFQPGTLEEFDAMAKEKASKEHVPVPSIKPDGGLLTGAMAGFETILDRLPDNKFEILAQTTKLNNAEAKLAEERFQSARAAEKEAAALREKNKASIPSQVKPRTRGSQSRLQSRTQASQRLRAMQRRQAAILSGRRPPSAKSRARDAKRKAAIDRVATIRAARGGDKNPLMNRLKRTITGLGINPAWKKNSIDQEMADTDAWFRTNSDTDKNKRAREQARSAKFSTDRTDTVKIDNEYREYWLSHRKEQIATARAIFERAQKKDGNTDGMHSESYWRAKQNLEDVLSQKAPPVVAPGKGRMDKTTQDAVNETNRRDQDRRKQIGDLSMTGRGSDPSSLAMSPESPIGKSIAATDDNSALLEDLNKEIMSLRGTITSLQRDGMPTWLRA